LKNATSFTTTGSIFGSIEDGAVNVLQSARIMQIKILRIIFIIFVGSFSSKVFLEINYLLKKELNLYTKSFKHFLNNADAKLLSAYLVLKPAFTNLRQ